jgi:hypothetical protein
MMAVFAVIAGVQHLRERWFGKKQKGWSTGRQYWTLIRGAERTGSSRADSACPNCGAPLALGMAAVCRHCKAKINSGAFDWVLSRIEQDEVYAG